MTNRGHAASTSLQLSKALLRLHKTLLDTERAAYERLHGPIPSNGALLQLIIGHPSFAWLRDLSRSMARLDELAEAKEPSSLEALDAHMVSLRTLLTPMKDGEEFNRRYHDVLERNPDAALAHTAVVELLSESRWKGGEE
jgi:hypothetical protein